MKCVQKLKERFDAFLSLFLPRRCTVCGEPLVKGEACMCILCNINLPRTNYHLRLNNPIERNLWGKVPLERASSYFFYRKGSNFRHILHQLKYRGQKELGETMGRCMAAELSPSQFFRGVDVIVPIPLHKKRQRLRRYNQSEWIARGISAAVGIPISTDGIVRKKNAETQTRKSTFARWENVDGIFELRHPEHFLRKHILLVDDVLTTGATVVACASCLTEVEGVRISVLTLAVAE